MVGNKSASLSLNSTYGTDFYDWCTEYPTVPLIWSTVASLCFLLGFPASLWVLHDLVQKQRQKSTSDFFMLSLSVIDLTFTAQLPFIVCNFLLWHNQEFQIILVLIYSLSLTGRPLFMACICWDCYVAVVYPITYKTSKKLIVVKKTLTITIYCITAVAGLTVCNLPWLITTPYIASPFMLALPVITFCDISIYQALRKPDPSGNNRIHPQKKQALHTISASFIMTSVVYIPPTIIFSLGKLLSLGETEIFCCISPCAFSFTTAGCVIMPILYLRSVGKLDTLKKWWKK
ncbi:lysophosphatidic acid receptor 6-like [Tachysurus fulvidraco]|uniref:lysophosphatidic acid receptor 6-like n=1 Tax=Tachysurus fulvidraco TaxID=1234273 RepID=UPI001FEDFC44|nr:lysophosphatidic acid receptor 6-like [Tachysurus fulvidraco]